MEDEEILMGDEGRYEFVEVASFPSMIYAEMAKEVLENNGIACAIQGDALNTAYGMKGTGIGVQAVIVVSQIVVEEAKDVLGGIIDSQYGDYLYDDEQFL